MNDNQKQYKEIIKEQKNKNPELFEHLLTKNKNVVGPFSNLNIKNNDGYYFTDPFTKTHYNKKHLLFSGCSITAGCGVDDIKKTWSYQLYNEINNKEKCSGYFNISLSGGSPIEILLNVLKYISQYSDPDYIFILFSNYGRDWNKFNKERAKNGVISDLFFYNLYSILDNYCKNKNIKLITTSWVDLVLGVTDFVYLDMYDKEIDIHNSIKDSFDSYYQINNKRFAKNVFKYIQDINPNMTVVGTDNSHPSEAVHYAWHKEFLYRMEDINAYIGN